MKLQLPEQVDKALEMLECSGFEAYIIGGCVRDFLLGKNPTDYDITTSAKPEEVKNIFAGYNVIETGIKHGTVTAVLSGMPLEITTFRIDSGYSDNRHPDTVMFSGCLREDVARRDFTVNSIAYSHKTDFVDYYNGKNDIENMTIRCIGDADKRFEEDSLRILRALRFSSCLGFTIEKATEDALFRNKDLLVNVSAERIAAEFVKMLCGKNVKDILIKYTDILGVFIPELLPMVGFEQKNPHHIYDVLVHTAVATEQIASDPILRMAAFFHDIGKPYCFTTDNCGIGHFYGHHSVSERIADAVLRRLKVDNNSRNSVTLLVKHHDRQIECTERAVKRVLNTIGPDMFFDLIKLKRADNLAQAPKLHFRQKYCDEIENTAADIIKKGECFSLESLAVNGNDLIGLGLKPGPQIGSVLRSLLDTVIGGEVLNERESLLKLAERIINIGD